MNRKRPFDFPDKVQYVDYAQNIQTTPTIDSLTVKGTGEPVKYGGSLMSVT